MPTQCEHGYGNTIGPWYIGISSESGIPFSIIPEEWVSLHKLNDCGHNRFEGPFDNYTKALERFREVYAVAPIQKYTMHCTDCWLEWQYNSHEMNELNSDICQGCGENGARGELPN